jgi:hypothetical protein
MRELHSEKAIYQPGALRIVSTYIILDKCAVLALFPESEDFICKSVYPTFAITRHQWNNNRHPTFTI